MALFIHSNLKGAKEIYELNYADILLGALVSVVNWSKFQIFKSQIPTVPPKLVVLVQRRQLPGGVMTQIAQLDCFV
jgi:hypothetical protein